MADGLLAALAIGGFVLGLLALVLALMLALRLRRLGRRRGQVRTGDAGVDLMLAKELERMDSLGRQQVDLAEHVQRLEKEGRRAVARVGVVRFNPFEDTGGNQSFALALLDGRSDGIIVSSLHSRQQTRIYLKAIVGGKCESQLSDEETEALRRAIAGEGIPAA